MVFRIHSPRKRGLPLQEALRARLEDGDAGAWRLRRREEEASAQEEMRDHNHDAAGSETRRDAGRH